MSHTRITTLEFLVTLSFLITILLLVFYNYYPGIFEVVSYSTHWTIGTFFIYTGIIAVQYKVNKRKVLSVRNIDTLRQFAAFYILYGISVVLGDYLHPFLFTLIDVTITLIALSTIFHLDKTKKALTSLPTPSQMEQKNDLYEVIEKNIEIGSWTLDLETNEIGWSDGMRRIYNYPNDKEIILSELDDMVHPDDMVNIIKWRQKGYEFPIPVRKYRIIVDEKIKHLQVWTIFKPPSQLYGFVKNVTEVDYEIAELETQINLLNMELDRYKRRSNGVEHNNHNIGSM